MNANALELQQLEDLEELAAYVDGHLPEERRRAVEERLARDPRYYEVFVETARFQQEEEEPRDGSSKKEAPTATRFPFWRGVAAAAAAAVFLAAGLALWLQRSPEPALAVASNLDAEALARTAEQWSTPGWTVARSPLATAKSLPADQVAFRIGVTMLHMGAHRYSGDEARALQDAGRLTNLAASPHAEAVRPLLRAIYANLQKGDPVEVQALDAEIRELLPSPEMRAGYAAGSWLALGRLAASTGQADLLQRRELRELLSTLAGSASTPEIQGMAAEAGVLLEAEGLPPEQLGELEERLKKLIILLGGSRLP